MQEQTQPGDPQCRNRLFLKITIALWAAVALLIVLFLAACGEPLEGSIAGHTLSTADTAFYEVVDNDDLSGLGLVIADSPYTCDELRTILEGGGDPVTLDNGRQVAFIHLQILLPPASPTPGRGTYPIYPDVTHLEEGAPFALGQIRLRQGQGYGLISQLTATGGEVSLTPRGEDLSGDLRLDTQEGEISGSFEAARCQPLGGALTRPETPPSLSI